MRTILNLPSTLNEDLRKFKEQTERFKSGEISADEFRVFRVPQGVYEQRESGTFMLRVRLPAGALLPHQMRTLAKVARRYGKSVLHVTTRQDIQVHRVSLDDIHPALLELYAAGLSTKGGGGNTVRNITACPHAGVCPREALDVAPYAVAVTEFLLPDPLNYQLPRKYKIAFSGCRQDCGGATVNDLGFIAKRRNGTEGFAVYAGGGMGSHARVAGPLEEFVPASQVHLAAEAVKRVFDKHGNRKNKHKARLRFLVERIGFDAFHKLYERELAGLREDPPACPEIRSLIPEEPPVQGKPSQSARREGFDTWRRANTLPQKQEGYSTIHIPLTLGDIAVNTMDSLADVVEAHGEGMLRTTQWQNAVLRWVHESELTEVHAGLCEIGLAAGLPVVLRDLVACTGAATCRLGICLSRGLAGAITEELSQASLDLHRLGELRVHISGCPNSCGRHPVAQVGLVGAARRVGGRLVPHYVIQLGGRVEEGRTVLATGTQAIPARNVPRFLAEFLGAFLDSAQAPDFEAFLEADGRGVAERLALKYKAVPDFETDKNYYFDWGATGLFSLAGRGPGECGAGVFDLIEVDLDSAAEALAEGRCYAASVLAARALLVTRGQQPADDAQVFELFRKHFLDEGLVDRSLERTIDSASRSAPAPHPEQAFDGSHDDVAALLRAVRDLYDSMDPSLRFSSAKATVAPTPPPASAGVPVAGSHDFRGVVCPLNYVRTKLALGQVEPGEAVLVLLDEEGAKNVPESAAKDGHKVLSVAREGDHWKVLIRKKA